VRTGVEWTVGVAGALIGAAACGIVVILVWFAIDPPPKYNNWDFVLSVSGTSGPISSTVTGTGM
jgi:hypothetical protein